MASRDEDKLLRSVALQNVQSILQARNRAEQELIETKEALEEETRILDLLNKTGAKLASNLDLQTVVQTVTDAATKVSGAQFGAFLYAEVDTFSLLALSGASREAFEKFGDPRATPIFGPTLRGEGVIRVGDVRQDPRYGPLGPNPGMPPGHLLVSSCLAVPVISRSGAVLGALFFGHRECNAFTERSERLVVGIAAQAAIAIDNARLYEDTKRSAEDRARLLEAERAARAEIERVSLLKDEFLATLSHELRTPLNAVLGWSEILRRRAKQDPEIRAGLETIARNARAQAQLIEDLLDMNRIVSGTIRLDVQRIELGPIVSAALDSVRPSADAKAIALRATIDPSAGQVFGDPNRLQQVVWNLLTNAVKFTPKGGKIDVIVHRVNSQFEIIVHDTGIGVSRAFLPHMFERFRQADSSTTRKYGGLGLGLSIVKQLVELHGGSVKAESPGEGKGTTFVVTLPIHAIKDIDGSPREHAKTARESLPPDSDVSLAGIAVLVIDDELDARELLKFVLTDAGAIVLTASSADEGVDLVKRHRPDVIVSDIGMSLRDGYHFIRDVRMLAVGEGGKTPAIALTAFARAEDRARAMLAGYQVHVSKPIARLELLAAIHSLVANRGHGPLRT